MAEPRAARGRSLRRGVACLLVAVAAGAAHGAEIPPPGRPAQVGAVIDGDTIGVRLEDGREERVRLLGIDAPELHPSEKLDREVRRSGISRREMRRRGAAARRALAALVHGRSVALEHDIVERDRYGRLLAWVWRRDGLLVNEAMVREGWALLLTIPPNVRHVERLREAQAEARRARRGIWGAGHPAATRSAEDDRGRDARPGSSPLDCPVDRPIKGNFRNGARPTCVYHLPEAPSYARTRPERCFATEAEAIASGCRPPGP